MLRGSRVFESVISKRLAGLVGMRFVFDLCFVAGAWILAFWFRFNLEVPDDFAVMAAETMIWPVLAHGGALVLMGVYRQLWRYTGAADLGRLMGSVGLGALATAAAILMMRYPFFPRSVLVLHPLLVALLLGAVRAVWRVWSDRSPRGGNTRPLLIVGSVEDAASVLGALRGSRHWSPAAIVSPFEAEGGRSLHGLPVFGGIDSLPDAVGRTSSAAAVIAALPGSAARREALMRSSEIGISLLTLPRADEWLGAEGSPGSPRKVELEDLLGRDPVQLDAKGLSELFVGETVLVTGAGGSIGSELCRQIVRFGVRRLICLDVSEYAIYSLDQELHKAQPQLQASYYTANVREADRVQAIFALHRPSVVFHAAAYKHVPLMEELNEIEALRTNVAGTVNAARAAGICGARRFVFISTDKAVNPTNVMGASKRLAELVVQRVAQEFPVTQYLSVRFGNVLGSSGSVVPLFTQQIARGGPVTVTHPEIVRYFMTIPEAAQLVLQAGLMGGAGRIFVLDMGEPVKIVELARMLIRLSGQTEEDIPIVFSGLRPGEKLFEELLANDETTERTPHPKLRVAKTNAASPLEVSVVLEWIASAGPTPASAALREWLRACVPEYTPQH